MWLHNRDKNENNSFDVRIFFVAKLEFQHKIVLAAVWFMPSESGLCPWTAFRHWHNALCGGFPYRTAVFI